MAARWNLLLTSSVCLLLCSLCMSEPQARGAMRQVTKQVYQHNDHIYTFHYKPRVTWEEARDICANETEGSYLAVIEDMDEAEFVAESMAGSLNHFVSIQDVWIGGHKVADRWIWDATGNAIPEMNGHSPMGLSAALKGKDCLLLGRYLTDRPKYEELQCIRKRSFLCEIGCSRLSDNDRGHWEPATCREQAGEMDDQCEFLCNPEYHHRGSDVMECNGIGWNGTEGFGNLPKCTTCSRLSDNSRGHWEPATCAGQAGDMGEQCKFVCNSQYHHLGSDVMECTGVGWNGTEGLRNLPKCSSCGPLSDNSMGHWEPANCKQQPGDVGEKCRFVCNSGYHQTGSDVVECTGSGWNGPGGLGSLPKCSSCSRLSDNSRGHWEPANCAKQPGKMGDKCKFVCNSQYQHEGSDVLECTGGGWSGSAGLGNLPKCNTPEELGEEFVGKIGDVLSTVRDAGLLFLLDESGSVAPSQFQMELTFVKAIIAAFPLSSKRSAGVITFSSGAEVDIHLGTSDTCGFLAKTNRIVYSDGGTDILNAMNLAIREISAKAVHGLTLVFLVTDGASSTNPAPAADRLKSMGHIVFTIGVAGYNRAQLEPLATKDAKGSPNFFGITSFEVFNSVANYLNTRYSSGRLNC